MFLVSKSGCTIIIPHSETQSYSTSPGHGEPQDVLCFIRTEFSYSTLGGIAELLWRRF
jgi:hypothetical protein